MSNSSNGGSTLLDVVLPPQLTGASPTGYYCGNLIWRQFMQSKETKNIEARTAVKASPAPAALQYIASSKYSELHLLACLGNLQSGSSYLEGCPTSAVNKQDHNGNTALHWAALQGQEDFVQLLIDNQAFLDSQNFSGETALFLASSYGFDNIVAMLLENGANPNITNLDGATAVHLCSAGGHTASLELLARFGAFVNCQDDCGDLPLHYAIREGHMKVVEQLVTRCNASVDLCNEEQESPLELASCLGMNDYVQFLSKFSQGSVQMDSEELTWN